MGRGKEAADDDEESKDRTYRPRTMPQDPDVGSSGAPSVRATWAFECIRKRGRGTLGLDAHGQPGYVPFAYEH